MYQMLKRVYDGMVGAIHEAMDTASYFEVDGVYRDGDIDVIIKLKDALHLFVGTNYGALKESGII